MGKFLINSDHPILNSLHLLTNVPWFPCLNVDGTGYVIIDTSNCALVAGYYRLGVESSMEVELNAIVIVFN